MKDIAKRGKIGKIIKTVKNGKIVWESKFIPKERVGEVLYGKDFCCTSKAG